MDIKPAIAIVSYNMEEVTLQWIDYLMQVVQIPFHFIVVDNGSTLPFMSSFENIDIVRVSPNLRTSGGVLLAAYRAMQFGCTHLWSISTSTFPPAEQWSYDPLERLMIAMSIDPTIAAVSPTFTGASKSWPHQLLMSNNTNTVEDHWLLGLFSLWDLGWLINVADWRLSWSWGIDFDLSYTTLKFFRRLLKHNGITVRLSEGLGYEMNRMGIDILERERLAREEMETILTKKYGSGWRKRLIPEQYVELM